MRKKKEQLEEALQGTLKDHHRFLLVNQLSHLDLLDQQIANFDREIAHRVGIDHSQTKPETADGKEPSGTSVSSGQEKAEPVQPVSALDRDPEDCPEVARKLHPPEPEPPAVRKRAAKSPTNNQEPAEPLEESATSSSGQTAEAYARAIAMLDGVTGINERIAQIIVAEIGIDRRPFPSEAHVASWVGLCPGPK